MSELTREELFKKAKEKIDQDKAEKEKRRQGISFNFENVEWVGLEDDKEVVGRIRGLPFIVREKPTDTKLIYRSKIRNDKNGYCYINWKQVENSGDLDKNWFLYRLYETVMERRFVKYPNDEKDADGRTGKYEYLHEDKPSFSRISINKSEKDLKNPKMTKVKHKFFPKKRVLMNFVDRGDSWCKDNNHTKVLTSKKTRGNDDASGNPTYFIDDGIPNMLFEKIIDDVCNYRGNWDLDVVLRKNSSDVNNAYIVRDILEDKINDYAKSIGTDEPLTEEELQYEMYDFDKLYKESTYNKIRRNILGLVKQVDIDFNTDFESELKTLVEEEAKENSEYDETLEKLEKEIEEEFGNVHVENSSTSETNENTVIENKDTSDNVDVANNESVSEWIKIFPLWDKLNENEKQSMTNAINKFENNIPIYKNGVEVLPCPKGSKCRYPGTEVNTEFPETVFTCPVCGETDTSSS